MFYSVVLFAVKLPMKILSGFVRFVEHTHVWYFVEAKYERMKKKVIENKSHIGDTIHLKNHFKLINTPAQS